MHWINFPVLFIMILSGLRIYWNDSDNAHLHPHAIYRIGFGSFTLFRLFPDPVYEALHLPWHVTQGMGDHFFFMWIFALNGMLTMADILKLPKHELVTEFKCARDGARSPIGEAFAWPTSSALIRLRKRPTAASPGMSTSKHRAAITMSVTTWMCASIHRLLATEMAGKPLTQLHGAPLRLHAPTKYGYKQIKRIGLIAYTDVKPDGYWTKLGYDWYAGL